MGCSYLLQGLEGRCKLPESIPEPASATHGHCVKGKLRYLSYVPFSSHPEWEDSDSVAVADTVPLSLYSLRSQFQKKMSVSPGPFQSPFLSQGSLGDMLSFIMDRSLSRTQLGGGSNWGGLFFMLFIVYNTVFLSEIQPHFSRTSLVLIASLCIRERYGCRCP